MSLAAAATPSGTPKPPVRPGLTVLQVLPALNDGGVEKSAVEMAVALKNAGGRPLVASAGGKRVKNLQLHDIVHIDVPLDRKNPAAVLWCAFRLVGIIRKEGVDLVHARSRAPAWAAWLACRLTGVAFVATFHGTYGLKGGWLKRLYNSVMLRGPYVIANSRFIAAHIVENYGYDPAHIVVASRGIDPAVWDTARFDAKDIQRVRAEWDVPKSVPVVMMVGRITRWKGHILLLHAMAELKDMDWRLVLVGAAGAREQDYAEDLKRLADSLGIGDRVVWAGSRDDVPLLLAAADVAVSASVRPEAFGRAAIEAMAMGKPVVATALGGSLETIIDGETGWLVRPASAPDTAQEHAGFGLFTPQAVAEKLRGALRKPKVLVSMAAKARKRVLDNYTVDLCCQREMEAYRLVLAQKRG